jgi:hypothetical protein
MWHCVDQPSKFLFTHTERFKCPLERGLNVLKERFISQNTPKKQQHLAKIYSFGGSFVFVSAHSAESIHTYAFSSDTPTQKINGWGSKEGMHRALMNLKVIAGKAGTAVSAVCAQISHP